MNGCICSANGHVYLEWLHPFRPNGYVRLGKTHFDRMDVSIRWTDVSVWKGYAHSNRTDVSVQKRSTRYSRKIFSGSYIKGRISSKEKNKKITQNSFSFFSSLNARYVQSPLVHFNFQSSRRYRLILVRLYVVLQSAAQTCEWVLYLGRSTSIILYAPSWGT